MYYPSGGTRRAVQRALDVTARHLRPFAAAWLPWSERQMCGLATHCLADRVLIRGRRHTIEREPLYTQTRDTRELRDAL